ncbi:MAG: tetratricopeptide repeat protein [Abditibacteriota bacterium]|nr:tetratricopeptide repeat protein [Abditibacteriota bacterium]
MTIDYADLDYQSIKNTNIGKGFELLKSNALKNAILTLEDGTREYSTSYEAFEYLGIAYLMSGHFNRAIGALTKACEIKPASATAHYNLAIAYENAKVYNDALTHFTTAAELNPTHTLAQDKIIEIAQIIPETKKGRIRLLKGKGEG